MKKFFVKMLLVLISAAVFIPTTATHATEKIEQKEDLVVTINPTELQKQLALRDVPLEKQEALLQAFKAIENANANNDPLATTNGPKGAAIKAAIKVIKGLVNNDWAKWVLQQRFGKEAVNGTVKNANKIIKELEKIIDTPKNAAGRARKVVSAELKKHIDSGVADTIGLVVEYIVLTADLLIL
ncbi:hypothetical protein [Bacillus sp. NMCN1]|uniref:hypothetical protein n=1 Tax=Bacillus sp. NMCN1 TaxID=2108536 RepID=UPI000D02C255|nr:hypothetical protein [Bacillus sp. NMCN1]PRR92855.1 hypothetical protein C6W21_05540 [Bacillus sp. NMCN1]